MAKTKTGGRKRYVPDFNKTCLPWVKAFLGKRFWEVRSYYEYEDLMQDAWLYFLRIKNYYCDKLDRQGEQAIARHNRRTRKIGSPKWFFGVFRIAFERHFARIKQKHMKYCQEITVVKRRSEDGFKLVDVLEHIASESNQELSALVRQCQGSASWILREVTGSTKVTRRILGRDPVTGRITRHGSMVRV